MRTSCDSNCDELVQPPHGTGAATAAVRAGEDEVGGTVLCVLVLGLGFSWPSPPHGSGEPTCAMLGARGRQFRLRRRHRQTDDCDSHQYPKPLWIAPLRQREL